MGEQWEKEKKAEKHLRHSLQPLADSRHDMMEGSSCEASPLAENHRLDLWPDLEKRLRDTFANGKGLPRSQHCACVKKRSHVHEYLQDRCLLQKSIHRTDCYVRWTVTLSAPVPVITQNEGLISSCSKSPGGFLDVLKGPQLPRLSANTRR
ncbi:unnamed protein product [Pleuronectes platessa]|uniref:Uncharacterized protein n=1 Tax=Pleuronectes platessa TaxID=8262 RepID=A0A9N7VAM0_PLEPL|nr:unnamed protein product [Pleuronectes platessa]